MDWTKILVIITSFLSAILTIFLFIKIDFAMELGIWLLSIGIVIKLTQNFWRGIQ